MSTDPQRLPSSGDPELNATNIPTWAADSDVETSPQERLDANDRLMLKLGRERDEAVRARNLLHAKNAALEAKLEVVEKQRDNAQEERDDARRWARHGYEIGQRTFTWTDDHVAPKWLTEGHDPAALNGPPPHAGCEAALAEARGQRNALVAEVREVEAELAKIAMYGGESRILTPKISKLAVRLREAIAKTAPQTAPPAEWERLWDQDMAAIRGEPRSDDKPAPARPCGCPDNRGGYELTEPSTEPHKPGCAVQDVDKQIKRLQKQLETAHDAKTCDRWEVAGAYGKLRAGIQREADTVALTIAGFRRAGHMPAGWLLLHEAALRALLASPTSSATTTERSES